MTVDIRKLATGLVDLTFELAEETGENYDTALALGMLPAPLMKMVTRNLESKFRELHIQDYMTAFYFQWDKEEIEAGLEKKFQDEYKQKEKDWIKSIEKALAVEMLRVAKDKGILVV